MAIAFAAASLVERVGWLLVHSVWQFALIAIVLAVVLRMMRSAPAGARYAAALIGWGLMLAAPAVTWPLLPGSIPLAEVVATVSPNDDVVAEPLPLPADANVRLPTPDEAFDATVVQVANGLSSAPAEVVAPPVQWTEVLAARIAPWLNTLVVIWCVGVCLFGARSARGWFAVQGLLRRDVVSVPDEMTTLLVSVLKRIGLRHRVRLLQSPHVDVPLVVGWLRPVILLPVCVATGFPPQQLEAILAHELAHVRRHDYLINLLQNLSETVFFYHPALWWASAVVRREREHCCDELAARALGNRAEYGRALLALEELRGTTPSLALGATGGSLLERMRRLAQREPNPRLGAGGVIGIGLVATVALSAAVWTAGIADDRAGLPESAETKSDGIGAQSASTADVEIDATELARNAHAQAAAIDTLPKFYVRAKSRYTTSRELDNPGTNPLDNLFRALDVPVPIEELLYCERIFAWDEKQFLDGVEFPQGFAKGEPTGTSTENEFVSSYRWGSPELGIWRDQYAGQQVQYSIRRNAAAVWNDQYHLNLNYLRTTLHRFWWGANNQLDGAFNPVVPSMAEYQWIADEIFDGEECQSLTSSVSQDVIWISKKTGVIRGYLHRSYHGDTTEFYKSPDVAEVAGRTFATPKEYSSWHKTHVDDLSVEQRSRLSKAWGESIRFRETEPRTLVRFHDFREIAPGILWPYREDVVFRGWSETGFKYSRSDYEVVEVRFDLDLTDRIAKLHPKEGQEVQDQRFTVPVEYAYRQDIPEAEILKLVDTKRQQLLEGQAEVVRLAEPISKLVGQPAPTLPREGWVGGTKPDVIGKPYLLHFWATWCGPCKNDLPILKSWAEDGALIIGMHPSGTPCDEVQKAVDENELPYATFVESTEQPSGPGRTIAGYPADMFPYCILVDADGRVAGHGSLISDNGEIPAKFRELRAAKAAAPDAKPVAAAVAAESASAWQAPSATTTRDAESLSSPIGPLSEVSVADQVARYAFEAEIPADHYLGITLNEVPQRRGYSQANIQLRKPVAGKARVELEFQYAIDERGAAANPLLSNIDEIQYGWSAPGCEPRGAVSIFGVPDFKRPTEDKKIVLVDPGSDLAQAENGTRLLLIIPKDTNPHTRAEVEAIQPRGEIVALLRKIEPAPAPPSAEQRLLARWRSQLNAIGTSYVRFRRLVVGAGRLQPRTQADVAEMFARDGEPVTADEALEAARGLFVDGDSQPVFGPDSRTYTFRSVGNKTLETSERNGESDDIRYYDGEIDVSYSAANRQLDVHGGGGSRIYRLSIGDFHLPSQLEWLDKLDVTPRDDSRLQVRSGPFEFVVNENGFVDTSKLESPKSTTIRTTYQFDPETYAGGVVLPRLRIELKFEDDALVVAKMTLVEEARINDGFAPDDFRVALPGPITVVDYRGRTENPRVYKQYQAIEDATAHFAETSNDKATEKPADGAAAAEAEDRKAEASVNTEAASQHTEWVAKLLRLKNHNQTAFAIGPTMLSELEPDEALAVVREAWPQIKVEQVKTGLLKTFEFDRHPHVLEVLDLGATDDSEDVRKYAGGYLQNYAFRDFGGDPGKYAAWRKEAAGKPVLEIIKANAEWFVADQKSKMPADDQRWWMELEMMLNLSGNKSSYPEKAVYLGDAGFVELLKKWCDESQAGSLVKTKSAELIQQIQEAVAAVETAGGEGRPAVEGAARSGDRPEPGASADPDRDQDGGSKLLRETLRKSASVRTALAEKHGFALAEGEDIKRLTGPFPPERIEACRIHNPGLTAPFLAQETVSLLYNWKNDELMGWGMLSGLPRDPGVRLTLIFDLMLGIKTHAVEGPPELLEQLITGDWVFRDGSSVESRVEQMSRILSRDARLPVRLELRTVERPAYVVRGSYQFTPLPGKPSEDRTQLTDRLRIADRLYVFGRDETQVSSQIESQSIRGGSGGDFDEFLDALGQWIGSPIISEVDVGPTRELSWTMHAAIYRNEELLKLDHDPERVLANVTKQTGLTFEKANRDVKILFVEPVEGN